MKNRAYSLLTVKSVSEDRRVIRGMATTPAPDRHGDVVEPLGATFAASVPLLWQHDHDKPVGRVKFGTPTAEGIPFEAELPVIEAAGILKDRVDEAWQSVAVGLVGAVSIGFRSLEHGILENGGYRFIRYEIFELSLVTIPANAEATLELVKSLDANRPPLSGQSAAAPANPAPVEGNPIQKGNQMTLAEKIAAREAMRKALVQKMNNAVQKSLDGEGSMSAEEQATFDEAKAEIENLDAELGRLKSLEALTGSAAAPVAGGNPTAASGSRAAMTPAQAKEAAPEPGIRFARYARCLALAKKGQRDLAAVAKEEYGYRDPAVESMVKAAVGAQNTTSDRVLVEAVGGFQDFVEFLRPQTIIGRFGQNGIPALTRIDFYVPVLMETQGHTGYWVGEGKAIPMSKAAFEPQTLVPKKVGGLAVATMEQLRNSTIAGEILIRNSLAQAVIRRIDSSILDAGRAESATSPGSFINGVPALTPSGSDLASVEADLGTLMAEFVESGNPLNTGVWIMSSGRALRLSLMRNAMGQKAYPDLTLAGGTLEGLPVIASQYAGDVVALVNAADIYLGDDGGVEIEMSTDASLEMSDTPDQDATTGDGAAELVSLFQTGAVGFRALRTMSWRRKRASAVAWMDGVTWGNPAAPAAG